jgi:hypothetical protein
MKNGNTYVYFALKGDKFDPSTITKQINLTPTETKQKGDIGKYKNILEHSSWELSTEKGREYLDVEKIVEELIDKLFDKIEIINALKKTYDLNSVLQIVLYVDTNEEESTPILGHELKTIEFLFKTETKTDIDIYRFDSSK